jgi:spore germination protein KB
MNKVVISDKQAVSLVILFVWGSALVIGTAGDAKKDMWLAMLLGVLMASFMVFIYCKILSSFYGLDVFDINKLVFGRFVGKLINLGYIFYAYTLGALVLNNFTEFISALGLPETPKVAAVFPIVILSLWGVKLGIETLGRWAEFFVVFLFIIIIIPTVLGVPQMELNNIRPFLEEGVKPVIKGAVGAFSFPFAETVVFLMFFSSLKSKKSIFKCCFLGLWIAGIVLSTVAARNVLLIGAELLSRNYFPSYVTIARINVADFVQRIETLNMVGFLIAGFIKISLCLLAASNGLAKVFEFKDYRILVTPVALTMFAISFKTYESILETTLWVKEVYSYYAAVFQVILPLITLLGISIKKVRGTESNF